jgi:hypothetical protein
MRRFPVLACAAVLATALLTPGCAHADTILVNWDGSGDYVKIQEAADAAATGDTILIASGTYAGEGNRDVVFYNNVVTVTSEEGRRSVTIDGGGVGRGFYFTSGNDGSFISGLTFQNCSGLYGGGLTGENATVTVVDCDIIACDATGSIGGGGVCFRYGGSPTFTDVSVSSCQGESGAGMLFYGGATPTLTRVRVAGNMSMRSGAGCYIEDPDGAVSITDCVFYNNTVIPVSTGGGGLYLRGSDATITGCTFAYNKGNLGGCIRLYGGASPTIENCILAFSRAGFPIHRYDAGENPTISRCIVYGNYHGDDLVGTVSDTLHRDPRFCAMLSGDLTLCSNSWALPANNVWTVQMGAYGDGGCGDCDVPVEATTWGRVKALYE